MKKIPTVFERDWDGDRSRVLDQVHPGCEWVLAGEGEATQKIDGTCCLIREGLLYKRRELKKDETAPVGFKEVDYDAETGKTVGWMLVGEGTEDHWHREAWKNVVSLPDGTYELIGPKVQGNPENAQYHTLVSHESTRVFKDVPRTYEGIREWFWLNPKIEGIVFHHPDGRMAKIKLRDFGIKRTK